MTTEIVEYKPTEAAIADIQRFKGMVVDVSTPNGLAEGKAVARQIAAVRIALDKTRKKLKEDVLERGRQIDGQAKPLFARVAEIEDPINAQLEAKAKAEEREREEKIEAERLRILAEQQAAKEAEEKRMAEARAEIKRQQNELAKAEQERQRIEREARMAIELEQRLSRQKIEEAERAARRRREALLAWRAMHDPDLLVQDRLQTRWDFASGDDPEPILPGECDWLDGLPIAGPRGALP